MPKCELWGYKENVYQDKIGGDFAEHPEWELVAVFTNEGKALRYIDKSKLKTRKRVSFGGDQVFRNGSLLSPYQDCEIRDVYDPIVDPEI